MYRTVFLSYPQLFYEYKETEKKNDMQILQYHDSYEICLMTAGERYLFVDGICHILKPGDLYIVRPFVMHYTQSLDSPFYGRHLLNFSERHLDVLLTPGERELVLNKLTSCIIHLNPAQYEQVRFYFQGFSVSSNFLAAKLQGSSLLQLLVYLSKCMETTEALSRAAALPRVKPEILQAIQYINQHYAENLSLDFIANYVHLSKYYFCRQFSKTTGATFMDYLNNIRLSKAHQLLLNSDFSIAEIAAQTGYSSSVQLSRAFRAVYKVTPHAFRQRI